MKKIENLNDIKRLYAVICNRQLGDDAHSVQERISIIRFLEKVIKQQFQSKKDFLTKMDAFIQKQELMQDGDNLTQKPSADANGNRLKEIRKKKGLSQNTLALSLGISINYLSLMENGRKPLSNKALQFINGGVSH